MLRATLLCISLILSALAQAEPVAWDQSDEDWRTSRSEHFVIHFRSGYQDMARYALSVAERVHTELVPFFGQAPDVPTQMVLADDVDYSNGWATPLPFSQIRLFVSPPEDVAGLEHMDDWLHGLIRHEYVHVLHMNMAQGVPQKGRSLFGRLPWFFPHIFTPPTFIEGLAVYLETDHEQGYGRLDGTYYDMQMRVEVANGIDALDQAVIPLRDWPQGKAYLYGAYFMAFIAETYGDEALSRYLRLYSRQILPFVMQNNNARRIFGKSFAGLWQDYQQWLTARFSARNQALMANLREGESLPLPAGYRRKTAAMGDQLWLVTNNSEERSFIARWADPHAAGEPQALEPVRGAADLDVAADGRVVLSRQIARVSGRVINDVFVWSDEQGYQRLTYDMRLRKVRWSADQQSVIASRKDRGLSELWQLWPDGRQQRLWQSVQHQVLGDFDVCADGRLVAAMKMPGQGWNLAEYLPVAGEWRLLTDTRATENGPECQADGRVLYSADYDGVYNLYALDPGTGQVQQLTRVLGGAFEPRQLAAGIVYQSYTADGFQLMRLNNPQPLAVFNIRQKQGRYDYKPAVTELVSMSESAYSPWSTLRPHYWVPLWSVSDHSTSVGLNTGGSDALGRHMYDVTVLWDTDNSWADFSLTYLYDNRWFLGWLRSHEIHDLDLGIEDDWYATQEDTFLLQRTNLVSALEDRLNLHLGISAEHQSLALRQDWMPAIAGLEETLAGAALTFDNRLLLRNVHGIGWGSYADLVYESNDVLNSDYSGKQWQSRWQHTFDLAGRDSFAFQIMGGIADRGAEAFSLGGEVSEETLLFGRDRFALPGYVNGVQFGHTYYVGEVAYTAWLDRIEDNYGLLPLGIGDISGRLWYREGSAWFRQQHTPSLASVGAELNVDVVIAYRAVLPITIGVAQGLDEDLGENTVYVRSQVAF